MKFLQRLTNRSGPDPGEDDALEQADPDTPASVEPDILEREHEVDVVRAEQERLDELQQRQLRYARYAWQPPAQGGDRRADDADADRAGG